MTPDKAAKLLKNPEFSEWQKEIIEAAEMRLFSASVESAGTELQKLNVIKDAFRQLEIAADVKLKLAEASRKKAVI